MSKNIFHDIVPPERRSIRNIKIQSVRKDIVSEDNQEDRTPFTEREIVEKAPKKGVWFLALCCFTALVFSVLFIFSTAEIDITVKKINLDMNDSLTATKEGEGLLYSSVELEDKETVELSSAEQKEVSTKASGTVVVYNNQSGAQTLIAGTRLQTGDGLIFLLDNRIVVPAAKTVSGTKSPGNIEVSVHAEKAGAKYNVGLTDFTVVAFKGDPRFELVYAKGKKAIGGGNLGTIPVVSDNDLKSAKADLEEKLTEKILTSVRAQIPANSVLLDGMYQIKFIDLPEEAKDSKLVIGKNATFSGFIFDKTNLTENLAKTKKTTIPLQDNLTFDTTNLAISSLSEQEDILKFGAKGVLGISYDLDVEKLKKDVKGKSKGGVTELLQSYVSVEKASVNTYPLWLIPRNVNRIKINLI